MTLSEAIEELQCITPGEEFDADEFYSVSDYHSTREAIATILNAVVKGELK